MLVLPFVTGPCVAFDFQTLAPLITFSLLHLLAFALYQILSQALSISHLLKHASIYSMASPSDCALSLYTPSQIIFSKELPSPFISFC